MWAGLCLALAFLHRGLGASGGGRWVEYTTGNWSAGLGLDAPRPTRWTVPPATGEITANGTGGARGEPAEPPLACHGEGGCPPWSHCQEQDGHNSCRCELGYRLLPTLGCVPVRAFPARLLLPPPPPSEALGRGTSGRPEEPQASWVSAQVQSLFHKILGHLHGYLGTSIEEIKWPGLEATVMHHFSARVPITIREVEASVAAFRTQCLNSSSPLSRTPACALLRHEGTYQSLSLCDFGPCDAASTTCSSQDGFARCACRPGYLQAHTMDRTCTACGSGFWLQEGTCARCPFGFGGPGCQEPFLLALVVVSCFAGLLLLLLLFLFTAAFLPGRAQQPPEPPSPPQLPLHSPTLSLPRVRPPWTATEAGVPREGSHPPHSALWDSVRGPSLAASTPTMETFLGSPRTPPSAAAPRPLGGTSNLVFFGDGEEERARRSYF